ncbi:MAG: SDR family NAD(P)-dependent oxidoreductase [Deltaproteobacteria bacterium]|nr:SDR family NAD(P)-dependent oxidoreductase [Deltaproteobacteria bacterium]
MGQLSKKIALITGASSGIGRACAEGFAREGAALILVARRRDRVRRLCSSLERRHGTRTLPLALDVRDREAVEEAIRSLPRGWTGIEILVNNAGLSRGLEPLHRGRPENWEEMIDTNVKGLLYVSRAVLPGMVKRRRGHIVNLGSVASHEVYPGGNVYCASKHAVDAITKGMMMDLVDTPIRVSTVDPGLVETEFSMVRFDGDRERARGTYKGMKPLKGKDVAEAILFCVTRPPHVNVNQLRIMPTAQASSTMVHRKG